MNHTIFPAIPVDTAKAARAVFGSSNFYLTTGDQADSLFSGLPLAASSKRGWKSERSLAMLYLITIFQFMETLPDPLAANASRERADWKYALHLPLNHPGFSAPSFCEFRQWLKVDLLSRQNLQALIFKLSEAMAITGQHPASLEVDQVIGAVCLNSRLAKIWDAVKRALEVLAIRWPAWLLVTSLPHWYERYGHLYRGLDLGTDSLRQHDLAQEIGADGFYLLEAISKAGGVVPADLFEISELRQIWCEQFEWVDGQPLWKKEACAGCPLPGSR